MSKHNRDLLIEAARLLKPLLGKFVFVGGSTTGLLITDKAAAEVRPTYDVDAIAEISSYAEYADFSERLRNVVSVRTKVKELPFAAGVRRRPFWM